MCGIAGYIGEKVFSKDIIKNTLNKMSKRGPDSQNYFYFKNKNGDNIYLLSSRLNIVNQNSNSDQPFKINDYIIVYNGEIYNLSELRKRLKVLGIRLRTTSDTEIILQYFIHYGEKCLKFLEGMWSFVIYNKKTDKIFFSRDRFGEKPLFYYKNTKDFYFGSEIKFIESLSDKKIKVNSEHLVDYLNLGYKSLNKYNETYFENIKEYPKKTFSFFKIGKKINFNQYWELNYKENTQMTEAEAIKIVRTKIIKSVEKRLHANVPVGICLSGGVDSSIIASVAKKILNKKIHTFSIINNDIRYNEKNNIQKIIKDLKVKNNLVYLKRDKNLNKLENLIDYRAAPIATVNYYNHSLMLENMKKNKIKVSILGTAADEIFGGYYDHFLLHLHSLYRNNLDIFKTQKFFFNKYTKELIRNPLLKNPYKYINSPNSRSHIFDEQNKINKFLLKKSKKSFKENKFTKDLFRNRMLNELNNEITPIILNEDDLNSMNFSIENRNPYLDSELVKFAFTIPSKFLIKDGYNKYILRQAFKDIVKTDIILDRKKVGFNSSIDDVFNLKNKNIRNQILDKSSPIFDFVDYDKIKKLFNKTKYENYLSKFIFSFINANIFLKKFY